jgi:TetR/AcrR family transcriptional regulator
MDKHISKEENILNVAREVFLQNGYDGTSMQMIADIAGINKSLLHYYYRSKERLFEMIFSKAFSQFLPHLGVIFMSDMSLDEKIYAFVERYIDVFIENPLIPIFVMQELSKNPQNLANLIREAGINPDIMIQKIMQSLAEEDITLEDPRHFMVNLISLCVFPFAARPLVQRMIFNNNEEAYNNFLIERKKEIPALILNAIRKA